MYTSPRNFKSFFSLCNFLPICTFDVSCVSIVLSLGDILLDWLLVNSMAELLLLDGNISDWFLSENGTSDSFLLVDRLLLYRMNETQRTLQLGQIELSEYINFRTLYVSFQRFLCSKAENYATNNATNQSSITYIQRQSCISN